MISSIVLQYLVLLQGLLLVSILGFFFGHGLWLIWHKRHCQARWARAQAMVMATLAGAQLPQSERAWLRTIPRRLQIRLLTHLAPSLSGAQKRELTALAQALGLLTWAERRCWSMWWWRRLQGARLLSVLGGSEDIILALLQDREALIRAQAAELAMAQTTPAVVQGVLAMLGDENGLCRFTAQDTLLHLGQAATEPLVHVLSVPNALQVEAALVVAVGLAEPRFCVSALSLCHHAVPRVRALAATLLGALGGREGVEVLTALLADTVPEVRAAAAHALGKLRYWPAAATLAGLLHDTAWSVRHEAGLALRSLGAPGMLFLRRSLQDTDRFAADMARQVLDLPDITSIMGAA